MVLSQRVFPARHQKSASTPYDRRSPNLPPEKDAVLCWEEEMGKCTYFQAPSPRAFGALWKSPVDFSTPNAVVACHNRGRSCSSGNHCGSTDYDTLECTVGAVGRRLTEGGRLMRWHVWYCTLIRRGTERVTRLVHLIRPVERTGAPSPYTGEAYMCALPPILHYSKCRPGRRHFCSDGDLLISCCSRTSDLRCRSWSCMRTGRKSGTRRSRRSWRWRRDYGSQRS